MPFTFSHPAAILPLRSLPKRFYSLTGLIAGSIAPDFEYFIRMNVGSIYSHTLGGIFYFDIPIGIAICFLFHDVVRDGLIDHLPVTIQQRFYSLKEFNWDNAFKQNWFVIILSIVVGALSHVLWDSFTHPLGYFVHQFAFLRNKVQILSYRVPTYNILQSLSSLVGVIVVLNFIWRTPRTETKSYIKKDFYWPVVFTIAVLIMSLRFLNGLTLYKYGNVIVSLISSFFIALLCISVFKQNSFKNARE